MEKFSIFIKCNLFPLLGVLAVVFAGTIFISTNEAIVYDIVGLFIASILSSNFISKGISDYLRQITRK